MNGMRVFTGKRDEKKIRRKEKDAKRIKFPNLQTDKALKELLIIICHSVTSLCYYKFKVLGVYIM